MARVSTKDRMCCELAQTSFDECLASLDLILQGVTAWSPSDDKLRLTCMDDRYLTVLRPELTLAKLTVKVYSFKNGIE